MVPGPLLRLLAALTALLPLMPPGAIPGVAMPINAIGSTAVEGVVTEISGDQLPGPGQVGPRPAAGCTVIAVSGPLTPLRPGEAFLPSQALQAPILARARCDSRGRFRLLVPAAGPAPQSSPHSTRTGRRLTLLLQVPGGFYLNHFDGQGDFASIELPLAADHPPIVLRNDRGALY